MAVSVSQTTPDILRNRELFAEVITSTPTFDANTGIRQIAGTRDKFSMANLFTNANILQAYADAPPETGDITIADDEFDIIKRSINVPFPYDQLANTQWKDAVANIHEMGIPSELQGEMLQNAAEKVKAPIENEIWNNNDGITGSPSTIGFDGFFKQITDRLTTAGLTANILSGSNDFTDPTVIQAQFNAMIQRAGVYSPAMLDLTKGAKLIVHPAVDYAYRRSLETQNQAVLPQSSSQFSGFEIVVIPNINVRTMLFGFPSNLAVGTPSDVNDLVNLSVIDQKENLKNQANIFGNLGYGAGSQTTDFVINNNTTP